MSELYDPFDDHPDVAYQWVIKAIEDMRRSLDSGEKLHDPDIRSVERVVSIKQDGYLVTAHIIAECDDGSRRKLRIDVTDEPRTDWHPGHYEFEVTEVEWDAQED